jgi:hypothetical protein
MEPSVQPPISTPPGVRTFITQNKKIITGVLVVLVFGLLVFLNQRPAEVATPTTETLPTTTTQDANPVTSKGPSTLTALLAQNIPQECTFSMGSNGTENFGTVYLANGKMRVDAQVRINGGPLEHSYMLNDGTDIYVWGDKMPQGVKMSVSSAQAQPPTGGSPTPASVVDPNQEVAYDCLPNVPTGDMFMAPSTVTFTDLSAMMQGSVSATGAATNPAAGGGDATSLKASQCAACSQAGDGADACRQALNCGQQ